jgi:SAM-dependent methyltransferase
MLKESTDHVRSMYDAYPFPSPVAGDGLINDTANLVAFLFASNSFSNKRILDAGCGTGHRLLGFAKRFPNASFLGIDIATTPLNVARKLAEKHRIANIRFRQGDLMTLRASEKFDLVVSTGVIHHLEDPEKGLKNLCECLASGGNIILWLYHPYGEFDRLLQRELVLTLWDRDKMSFQEGIKVMEELEISLAMERYSGAYATRDNHVLDTVSMNVDGYLHPIVNAYRFEEALDMFARCKMDWAAVHSISLGNNSKLLDLSQASTTGISTFCLRHDHLFASESMRKRYLQLNSRKKLRVIELMTKPNGFCVIAGRKESCEDFDGRIQGNLIHLNA